MKKRINSDIKLMKKILSVLLTLILVSSIGVIGVQAAEYDPDRVGRCLLERTMRVVETPEAIGTYKYFGGICYSTSENPARLSSMYFSTEANAFVYEQTGIMPQGDESFNNIETRHFGRPAYWKVRVERVASDKKAAASGYIWHCDNPDR